MYRDSTTRFLQIIEYIQGMGAITTMADSWKFRFNTNLSLDAGNKFLKIAGEVDTDVYLRLFLLLQR